MSSWNEEYRPSERPTTPLPDGVTAPGGDPSAYGTIPTSTYGQIPSAATQPPAQHPIPINDAPVSPGPPVPPWGSPPAPTQTASSSPYLQPRPYSYRPAQRFSAMAIASFVLSILGFSVIAIILGAVALRSIAQNKESGRGLAIAGVVIGAATAVLIAVGAVIFDS